jgi:hypothetical protein
VRLGSGFAGTVELENMNRTIIEQFGAALDERSKTNYAYQRWLMLLAVGAFSLTANLAFGKSFSGQDLFVLKVALTANAAGILFGAFSVCGESVLAKGLATAFAKAAVASPRPTVVDYVVPFPITFCEYLMYCSLLTSMLAWIFFIWSLP